MAEMKVLSDIKDLQGRLTTIGTNALQYKGHFNGDLNTLFGLDKVGIYALQHQCTNTPNDTDNYVFERAILTVKSDGTSTTHDLIATHFDYPTYVGKQYKRTEWSESGWQPWKCLDDEKLNRQGVTESANNLIAPSQFQYLLYNYDKGNFAGIGVGADGAINLRAGTSNELATYLKILGGGTATINDKKIATSDEITALQEKISQCMSNAGYGFISEDVLTNAGYSQPYVGSVNNSATMPNTGQWRVMYIPYVSPVEGYSVQVAYGCVGNDTIWYRKSHGLTWQDWKQVATTHKIDISSKLMGGWQAVDANCSIEATIVGDVLFVNGLIKNDGESSACLNLSQYPPKDGKWHGGSAIGGSGNAKYFVIDPHGSAQFQAGYEKGVAYTINFHYRVY